MFSRIFKDKVLIRNSVTAGAAMGIGNIICQKGITNQEAESIKYDKVLIFTSFGCIFTGPWFRFWRPACRNFLAKSGSVSYEPLKLTIIDQMVSPYVLNSLLIMYKNFFENESFQKGIESVKSKLIPIVANSYKFWPFVLLINFYFIQINYQFFFMCFSSIFWNIGLSYMVSR